jgi:hypothetical protein
MLEFSRMFYSGESIQLYLYRLSAELIFVSNLYIVRYSYSQYFPFHNSAVLEDFLYSEVSLFDDLGNDFSHYRIQVAQI